MTSADMTKDYRGGVRAWLGAHAPGPAAGLPPDEQLRRAKEFQAALYDAGFVGITWPEEVGGQGLGTVEQQVFGEEAVEFERRHVQRLGASGLRAAIRRMDRRPRPGRAPAGGRAGTDLYRGPAFFETATYHGGIGYTWEHDAHLYYKRPKSSELLPGTPSLHRARLADRLGV